MSATHNSLWVFSLFWPPKITGGPRLMWISLVQISLLRYFKTFHKYLPYANFGLFISLLQIFGQKIWLMRFFGYLFHYCYLPYANFGLFISLAHLSTAVAWREKKFKHFVINKYFCLVLRILKSKISKKFGEGFLRKLDFKIFH